MTGQSLLDLMEVVNQELQLQSGEADVTKGLLALNAALDYFESLVAQEPDLFGDTTGTVTTAASTETTTYPTGVLRIDRIQFIDPSTNLPLYDLDPDHGAGSHKRAGWPFSLFLATTSGRPIGYWTDGRSIYWDPLPNATHTLRWYGLQAHATLAVGTTFSYPDIVALPLAAVAARIMATGVGDDSSDLANLANSTLGPVVRTLANANRDGAAPLKYRYNHTT